MANGQIAEVIAQMAKDISDLKTQVEALQTQVNNLSQTIESNQAGDMEMFNNLNLLYNDLADNTSRTTTTPPTVDGTGLPGFVILDTKPETEYQNYVYIYPKE